MESNNFYSFLLLFNLLCHVEYIWQRWRRRFISNWVSTFTLIYNNSEKLWKHDEKLTKQTNKQNKNKRKIDENSNKRMRLKKYTKNLEHEFIHYRFPLDLPAKNMIHNFSYTQQSITQHSTALKRVAYVCEC
jgi:hypothetical protein